MMKEDAAEALPRIRILTTGGTIDKIYFDALSEFQVGAPQIGEVLRQAHVEVPHAIEALFRKDSLELTEADRAEVRSRIAAASETRFLVTHGTDTMVETGLALLGLEGRTIVLTGALTPARFRENDAIFNIGFALGCAQCLPPGVYLAMHGRIFDPRRTRKNRDAGRFEEC
jgi:L-asparaginase